MSLTTEEQRVQLNLLGWDCTLETRDGEGTYAETWKDRDTGMTLTVYRNGRLGTDAQRMRAVASLLGLLSPSSSSEGVAQQVKDAIYDAAYDVTQDPWKAAEIRNRALAALSTHTKEEEA